MVTETFLRPITLLSRIREALSLVIHMLVIEEYQYHLKQYEFPQSSGTELATVCATSTVHAGHKALTALDLKGTYHGTRRDVLPAIVRKWLTL